jgi:hypothetical protein
MNVTRDEAAQALEEIGRAGKRMNRLSLYADMAPNFILWGVIWLACNLVTEFRPDLSGLAWTFGTIVIGTPLTLFITIRQARRSGARMRQAGIDSKALGTRFALLGVSAWAFFISVAAVASPLNERQFDAFISLFFAFAYLIGGVFGGWRLMAIGGTAAAGILFGYFALHQHFYLWMGLVGGGALFAGGLWLRKA